MYTLSQIRNRVETLKRKYAKELAIYRLRRLAENISNDWAIAVANRREIPKPLQVVRRVADTGQRSDSYMELHRYIEGCRDNGTVPNPLEIVSALLPWTRLEQYAYLLRYNLPAEDPA